LVRQRALDLEPVETAPLVDFEVWLVVQVALAGLMAQLVLGAQEVWLEQFAGWFAPVEVVDFVEQQVGSREEGEQLLLELRECILFTSDELVDVAVVKLFPQVLFFHRKIFQFGMFTAQKL
jgi:hypothetical protein